MTDLLNFLEARIAEDEAHARNAFGDHNDAGPGWQEQWSGALNIGDAEDLILTNDSQVSRFMARFDPARMLRDVEAKRRIVGLMRDEPSDVEGIGFGGGWHGAITAVAEYLTLPYADHPDYDPRWSEDLSPS